MQSRKGKVLHVLLQELSDDKEDTTVDPGLDVLDDPQRPWLVITVPILTYLSKCWKAVP